MYLREKGIKFEEKDVNVDANARSEFARRGLSGVPAFLIGEEVVVGLDMNRIEALLDYTVTKCTKCGTKMRVPKGKGKIRATCPSCKEQTIINT